MIICGTGHRPDKLGGYGDDASLRLRLLARDWIMAYKPTKVISGMALGWDQALAWGAYDNNVPFVAAIPFAGQESRWPESSRRYFADLLGLASETVIVCEGGYAPWKMQERNKWMVDNSDQVLALWNGSDGGTANCVRYAQNAGKPVINLWEAYEGT